MNTAEEPPSWLVAWRQRQGQAQVPAPPPPRPSPPTPAVLRNELHGFSEPLPWPDDGGVRREPVLDTDYHPPRVIRRVGWQKCLRCQRPFFSDDIVRLRLCDRRDNACRE